MWHKMQHGKFLGGCELSPSSGYMAPRALESLTAGLPHQFFGGGDCLILLSIPSYLFMTSSLFYSFSHFHISFLVNLQRSLFL